MCWAFSLLVKFLPLMAEIRNQSQKESWYLIIVTLSPFLPYFLFCPNLVIELEIDCLLRATIKETTLQEKGILEAAPQEYKGKGSKVNTDTTKEVAGCKVWIAFEIHPREFSIFIFMLSTFSGGFGGSRIRSESLCAPLQRIFNKLCLQFLPHHKINCWYLYLILFYFIFGRFQSSFATGVVLMLANLQQQ